MQRGTPSPNVGPFGEMPDGRPVRLFTLVNRILATTFTLEQKEKLREFFYKLRQAFIDWNYLAMDSADFKRQEQEIERLVNASGPTMGEVTLRDGKHPKSVGIIHCVGSRDEKTNKWCSRVCCMYSLKLAHLIKEHSGAEVYNFYIDMRTPGKGYEEFYDKLLSEGVHFIRGRVAEVTDAARGPGEKDKLIVQAEDTLLGKQRRIPVDMVILMGAMEPRHDAKAVSHRFGIGCSEAGFFTERHPKLDPVATMSAGVFIAGACQGQKDIPASVGQGAAAAARVLTLISQGEVEIEPIRATINEDRCSGCRICNNLCPYNAIDYIEDLEVSRVNPALCKGCGTCVAACPSQVITGQHYTFEAIMAQIEGMLYDVRPGNGRISHTIPVPVKIA